MVQKFIERICSFKNIDAKFYASDYYDVNVNKYGVKCGTSDWINKIDPYLGFRGILGSG